MLVCFAVKLISFKICEIFYAEVCRFISQVLQLVSSGIERRPGTSRPVNISNVIPCHDYFQRTRQSNLNFELEIQKSKIIYLIKKKKIFFLRTKTSLQGRIKLIRLMYYSCIIVSSCFDHKITINRSLE